MYIILSDLDLVKHIDDRIWPGRTDLLAVRWHYRLVHSFPDRPVKLDVQAIEPYIHLKTILMYIFVVQLTNLSMINTLAKLLVK